MPPAAAPTPSSALPTSTKARSGAVEVVPNRVMSTSGTARRAYLIDPDMVKWLSLRAIQEVEGIAKTGDRESGVVLAEGTLKIVNEAGIGVIADLFGLTAST
jgi:hypothetical protein